MCDRKGSGSYGMLAIKQQKKFPLKAVIVCFALILLAGGGYLLTIVAAPVVAPLIANKPIEVKQLPAPKKLDNRIIIPKIGVNIPYASGVAALDRGAEWRWPNRGNPERGGNFIIAAHRFSIQPTPMGTIEKSPFYHIDRLDVGDTIIVDYDGARYAYKIDKKFKVKPSQTEIESHSDTPKLTLYSCELGGSEAGRDVFTGTLLGEVAVSDN